MRLAFALVLVAVLASIACGNVIARKYEYEEEIFLALDGSATVYVNASVPALVALRGVVAAARSARAPRSPGRARSLRDAGVARRQRDHVAPRGPPLRPPANDVADIRRLGEAPPFAWSTYRYHEQDGQFEFTQTMRAAAGSERRQCRLGRHELIAVRLHLPSKVT